MRIVSALAALVVAAPAAFAQQQGLNLPKVSPSAKVSATAGYTEVSVAYSSPAVKGRKIWGALVPNGQVWRAGANESTKVSFSTDTTVGGTKVPAGTYSFFAIPGEGEWTLILNKNTKLWGSDGYDAKEDLVRVKAKPAEAPMHERLAYAIADASDTGGKIVLAWEKLSVALPFEVDARAQALREIRAYNGTDFRPYNQAARWLMDNNLELPLALELADKSLKLKEDWSNTWTKAQLLERKGDKAAAGKLAARAQELGKQAKNYFYADDIAKAAQTWK